MERERRTGRGGLGGFVLALLLHAGLVALFLYGAWLGHYLPLGGAHPGSAAAGSITANLVSTVPGGAIPIPSPVIAPTKNRLASDNPAPGISKPPPRAAAPKHSVALPAYQPENLARKQALADLRKLAQSDAKADDRVHYGTGGRVSFSATTSAQGAGGSGGMSFGDANFGNLYAAWVNHLRDRLQYYWNQQPRDPSMPAGAKVTVTLTVHRIGNIDAIHYVARTNSVAVNAMAFATVQQLAQQERFPLPADYGKDSLVVTVAFQLN